MRNSFESRKRPRLIPDTSIQRRSSVSSLSKSVPIFSAASRGPQRHPETRSQTIFWSVSRASYRIVSPYLSVQEAHPHLQKELLQLLTLVKVEGSHHFHDLLAYCLELEDQRPRPISDESRDLLRVSGLCDKF